MSEKINRKKIAKNLYMRILDLSTEFTLKSFPNDDNELPKFQLPCNFW